MLHGLFFSETVRLYLNNNAVVNKPVNGRYCHRGIGKYLVPVAERLIRGDNHAPRLVTMGD